MADGAQPEGWPDEESIVQTAADAAEDVVFAEYRAVEIDDLDITVRFEDATLEVDVYLHAPGDAERVADDAARAARRAVDDRLE